MSRQRNGDDAIDTQTSQENPSEMRSSRWRSIGFALRMLEVRLRFVAVLVGLGLTIGYWDTIQNYWDRWTRPSVSTTTTVTRDTEFYCPMDPSVVRDTLEPNGSIPKCPICGMPLSLRKKGEPMELPPGVVGRVTLSPNRVRLAGIQSTEIGLRPLIQSIRTVGTVAYDQSLQTQIVSRINGYIEKLYVNKTFVFVEQGDPLAEIYSPELYAAIQELRVASDVAGSNLRKIAREKIHLLGIEDTEIDAMLVSTGRENRVVVRSPAKGFVIQKWIQNGSAVSAGQTLFEVADLGTVWIEADVYERDMAAIHPNQEVTASVEAYRGREFRGRVRLIHPELNPVTRTNRVHFAIANHELLLHPGMFATVKLENTVVSTEPFRSMIQEMESESVDNDVARIENQKICPVTGARLGSMGEPFPLHVSGRKLFVCCSNCQDAVDQEPQKYLAKVRTVTLEGVLSVPESAVIDTGDQKIVYIEREPGVYEGVEVQIGSKSEGYYPVISGLLAGDKVATSGAFLVDAETRLNPAASSGYFGASGSSSNASPGNASSQTNEIPPQPPTDRPDASSHDHDHSRESVEPKSNQTNSYPSEFPKLTDSQLAMIRKLSEEDQAIALAQVLCPVAKKPLGSMGKPIKVRLQGEDIFICCASCTQRLKNNSQQMIEQVLRWRASSLGGQRLKGDLE